MTTEQMKKASEILRATFPKPLIGHTVDVFKGLNSTERQILAETQKIYPPRLLMQNPR